MRPARRALALRAGTGAWEPNPFARAQVPGLAPAAPELAPTASGATPHAVGLRRSHFVRGTGSEAGSGPIQPATPTQASLPSGSASTQ